VCVCVCVCEGEREGERERDRDREGEKWLLSPLKLKEMYLLCRGNEVISRGTVFVGNTRTFWLQSF